MYVRRGLLLILSALVLLDSGCNSVLPYEKASRRKPHRHEPGDRYSRQERSRKRYRQRDYASTRYEDDYQYDDGYEDDYNDEYYSDEYYDDEDLVAGLPDAPLAPSRLPGPQPDRGIYPGTTYPGTAAINSLPIEPATSGQPFYSTRPSVIPPPEAGVPVMSRFPTGTLPPSYPADPLNEDVVATFDPLQLAPRRATAFAAIPGKSPTGHRAGGVNATSGTLRNRPMCVATHHRSPAWRYARARCGLPGHQAPIGQATANPVVSRDLIFHGGKTLPNLSYVNFYVNGDQYWQREDIENIELAIEKAMNDDGLNNVVRQYFDNQPIQSRRLPPHPLVGNYPTMMTRADIQYQLESLYQRGLLSSYDLSATVFNILLPSGTVLSDSDIPYSTQLAENGQSLDRQPEPLTESEAGDSRVGLGGYHGSIHVGEKTIYYTACVYSEQREDGSVNGIVAFRDPWKNVVATLYHELQEVRTDPDVEDAIRNSMDPNSGRYLGWVSANGEEIGDFTLQDGVPISSIIREVPLSDGSGVVPIQYLYSNASHGPEGPSPQLHAPIRR